LRESDRRWDGFEDTGLAFDHMVRKTSPALAERLRSAASAGVDTDGLLQETYIKALGNWRTVRRLSERQQLAWLKTTAGRLLIDELRKPDHRRRDPGLLTDEEMEGAGAVAEPDARFEARERLRRICGYILHLQPRYQDVLIMYGLLGHDQETIARALGLSRLATATAICRAREQLRLLESSDRDGEDL
jgi:RNA polymerase sigma factor (sigma-70 family)